MAIENDEMLQSSENNNHNNSNNNRKITADVATVSASDGAAAGACEKTTDQDTAEEGRAQSTQGQSENKSDDTAAITSTSEATGAKGKLNDLVADLYISALSNGSSVDASGAGSGGPYSSFGDYKNIRATCGPAGFTDGSSKDSTFGGVEATTSTVPAHTSTAPPTQNTFSFKHFLNSGSSQAPSSTVTSLDTPPMNTNNNSAAAPSTSSSAASTSAFQSSTGARPKVPQSSSVSATSISSLAGGSLNVSGTQDTTAAGTKMKRSPRFSSFDSQASLAGAAAEAGAEEASTSGNANFSGFRLHQETDQGDIFGGRRGAGACGPTSTTGSGEYDCQFVPRSYSHYDMQMPEASPRRRMRGNDGRPNRLSLAPSGKPRIRFEAHCFPGEQTAEEAPPRPNAADFPAAAAALPDFVQDHWLDSWYASEMHLNSPPNSPVCDFVQDLTGGANVSAGGGVASASQDGENPVAGGGGGTTEPIQRLPDFLSDGPIIHSSQRLADVAAGLPSNSMNSLEDASLKLQLNELRIENERYRRELSEARTALSDQTRRAFELEQQLHEVQRAETAHNRSISKNMEQAEENLNQSKRRQAAAQSLVAKLRQQVQQLTAEVECLRREKESQREEGAVGGCSSSSVNCDRPSGSGIRAGTSASAGGGVAGGGVDGLGVGARGNSVRPSRSQQISRDLLRAASNAENNLRQLLAGVDNLRQMASDIENSEMRFEFDVSPDLFSDYVDEGDDFEEYPGGHAL